MATLSAADRRLIVGHQAVVKAIRGRVEAYAAAVWRGLGSYRDDDIERLVELLVPKVLAGQRQIAGITDSYLAALSQRSGLGVEAGLVTGAAVRGGTAPEVVYLRPGSTVHAQLAKGATVSKAIELGGKRLLSLVGTDMQLAARQQASYSMQASGREFYRRVLTGGENCALCAIASTQRYSTADLMPIHPGCDCSVASIGSVDPGQVINAGLLEQLHDSIEEQLGVRDLGARDAGLDKRTSDGKSVSDYTDLVVTNIHGEYGPTLGWRGDKFTGPDDIAA